MCARQRKRELTQRASGSESLTQTLLRYQYEYYTREPSAVSSRVARNFPSSATGVASELKAYGDAQLLQIGVFTPVILGAVRWHC